MMRGGESSIYEQRYFQASNCHLLIYDASKPPTYAFMLNANNLYGSNLQNDHLPLKYVALDVHITLDKILKLSSTAQHGYISEVYIDYPPEIHGAHQDFPLAPSK